jgi:hypothetical protein
VRQFLSIGLDEDTPHHVRSRTRRLIAAEMHQRIFAWLLERLAQGGLIKARPLEWTRPRWKPTPRCSRWPSSIRGKLQRISEVSG